MHAAHEAPPPIGPISSPPAWPQRFVAWGLLAVGCAALALVAFSAPRGVAAGPIEITSPLTDQAMVIGHSHAGQIDEALRAHREATGVQMAVLIVRTTGGVPIEDFSYAIAEAWGGGAAGRDDGVLFVLAIDDRRMRLEVGRGLEDRIPDAEAARFIDALPSLLRHELYSAAVAVMVDQVIAATGGEGNVRDGLRLDGGALARGEGMSSALSRIYGRVWPIPQIPLGLGALLLVGLTLRRLSLRDGPRGPARRGLFYAGLRWWPSIGVGLIFGSAPVAAIAYAIEVGTAGILGVGVLGLLGAVLGVLLARWAARASTRHWRVQPRQCVEGDGEMRAVSPDWAGAELSPGQRAELAILSRSYDVWVCPNGHQQVDAYPGLSPARDCPECGYATVTAGAWSNTQGMSYGAAGLKEREITCAHCGYSELEIGTVAPQSHGSSGGSFGAAGMSSTGFGSSSSGGSLGGGGSSGGFGGGGGWSGGGGSFGGGGASGSW